MPPGCLWRPSVNEDRIFALACALLALPVMMLTLTFAQSIGNGAAVLPAGITTLGVRALLLGPCAIVAVAWIGHGRVTCRPAFAAALAVFACGAVTLTEWCVAARGNVVLTYGFVASLVQLNVIVCAGVAIVWRVLVGWTRPEEVAPRCPAWPLRMARVAIGGVLALAAADLLIRPTRVTTIVAPVGTAWGFFAVLLVEFALWSAAAGRQPRRPAFAVGVWLLFAVVLGAAAVAPFDTGNWLCFHVMVTGFAAVGWLQLYLGGRQARGLLGTGWQETFDTVLAEAGAQSDVIQHDMLCRRCSYNLRGLSPQGRCPECGTKVESSIRAILHRLSPQWAATLRQTKVRAARVVLLCAALAGVFAIRAAVDDPQRPWWSVGALGVAGALCITLAAWAPRRAFAYAGGLAVCLAASIWWIVEHWRGAAGPLAVDLTDLANVNIIAVALAGLVWLLVERRVFRAEWTLDEAGRWPALHVTAACVSALGVMLLAGVALAGAVSSPPPAGLVVLAWSAWAAAAVLLVACRLDSAVPSRAGLYGVGLAGVVMLIARAGLSSSALAWSLSMVLAAFAAVATTVWRRWPAESRNPDQASILPAGAMLLAANGVVAAASPVLALYVSFTDSGLAPRLLVVASPMLCAAAALFGAAGDHRDRLRTAALAMASFGIVLLAWSLVPAGASSFALQRAIGVVSALAVVILASSGARAVLFEGGWAEAITRHVTGCYAVAGLAVVCASALEVRGLLPAETIVLPAWATAAQIGALVTLIVACVLFAVRDRLDPARLPEGAKGAYLYTAEALAAALTLHIRVTMPWLFSGIIAQYWPLLLMGLSFAAIAAAEACARRGLRALAEPLGRTGLFLPALVLVELFLASSSVHFSIALLTVGALYAVVAALRRSLRIGLLAALALNGSLWYLLARSPGLGLTEHPQLWFIPPALAVLAAGRLNRARLTAPQQTAVHYICLLVMYLSSTADIFLTGVAQAPWLPLVLAGLSLVGVFVGFAFQVRSFFFLGTGFLCVSILTMIWHAAANLGWTWVWYVAGIALGAGIITLFALFEKKRAEIDAWLRRLRGWAG